MAHGVICQEGISQPIFLPFQDALKFGFKLKLWNVGPDPRSSLG